MRQQSDGGGGVKIDEIDFIIGIALTFCFGMLGIAAAAMIVLGLSPADLF